MLTHSSTDITLAGDPILDETTHAPTATRLDHLGLVAAAIDALKLVERIDKRFPVSKDKGAIVTHGQRVKAMIINGLGYTNSPLYLTPLFYQNKCIERLMGLTLKGESIQAEHLNDDALGRTLDAIFTYGTTNLFAEIAVEVAQERGLLGHSLHIDTTTLLLHGDFEDTGQQTVQNAPVPARGYSKAHRHDLKQLTMSLTVTGQAKMPLWFESLSGNSSDKANFHDSIAKFEAFKEAVTLADDFLWVADSALYNQGKLQIAPYKWLTRVPQVTKQAKKLVKQTDEQIEWDKLDNGYKASVYDTLESGQIWVLVYSEQAYKREIITFKNRVQKVADSVAKKLSTLSKEVFDCQKDALKVAKKWAKKLHYHHVEFSIQSVPRYSGKGRPAKDAEPDRIEYHINGTITDDETKQAQLRNQLGRFILATNDIDNPTLTPQVILNTYKEQQNCEGGFRFVKSDEFHLSHIYLKTPSRIDALMMVMTLTLMVYNTCEYQMHKTMEEQAITLPNQKGKQTSKPTLRWVFQMMQGIDLLKMPGMSDFIMGMSELRRKIIRLFGDTTCAIYGVIS